MGRRRDALKLDGRFIDQVDGLDPLGLPVLEDLEIAPCQIVDEPVALENAHGDGDIDNSDIMGNLLRREMR